MRKNHDGGSNRASSGRIALLLGSGSLVLGSLAAYLGSFRGPFLYDDRGSVVDNPTLRQWSTAFQPLATGWPVSGRPILNASFAVNYAFSGLGTHGYHVTNWLIHVAAGLLLFGLCRRILLRVPSLAASATGVAWATALFWTLSPLQTESVTYISQRAESLMGLCYLGCLYAFIRAYGGGAVSLGWAALSVVACFAGIGCKEVMVTAPAVALACDRVFVAGGWRAALAARRGYYCALCSSWVLLAALMLGTGMRGGTVGFGAGIPWWAYAVTQFRALATYVQLSFWPSPLLFSYGLTLGGPSWRLVLDAAFVLGLVGLSVVGAARGSKLGFLGVWYFAILAPTSSIVPISTELIAEHRVYLSLAAAACLVAVLGHALLSRLGRWMGGGVRWAAVLGVGASVAVAAAEIGATRSRNQVYSGVYALWADTVAKSPDDAGARNNLGNALAEAGRYDEAIEQFRAASRLSPGYSDPHLNLGNVLTRMGRDAEAVPEYRRALPGNPSNANVLYNLGRALRKTGDAAGAAEAFDRALGGRSESAVVWYDLGNAFMDEGRSDRALAAFGKALALRPDYPDALLNHAGLLAQDGRGGEAIREFQRLVKLEPDAPDVHNDLGTLLAQSGDLAGAEREFREAVRLKPDYAEARSNLERAEALGARRSP
ncbi:MAG: tetratricopeptide repeat protein [Opitutaceae bacterium]|jgi:tetratricopeptide (TPR) repeat protein